MEKTECAVLGHCKHRRDIWFGKKKKGKLCIDYCLTCYLSYDDKYIHRQQ